MTKISLQNIDNLQNESTEVSAINNNNAFTRAAMDNTLSRDGTAPNQMNTPLDMNSKKIINLIDATTDQEPVTFGQFNNTIGALNAGGVVTGSYVTLSPNSTLTQERILSAGNNISVIDSGPGTPSVPGTVTVGISDDDLNAVAALSTTGLISRTGAGTAATRTVTGTANEIAVTNGDGVSGNPTTSLPSALTFTGKTVTNGTYVTPTISSIINTGTLTLPTSTDTLVGKATTDTLTNKTYDTAGAGNSFLINGLAATANTGTGSVVRATSPTLVTPALGTPASGTLTNTTGLPISTGVSGLGAGVATFLATPSSANLATAMTDETGSGANVFATSPTLVTPVLGTPTSGTLTNCTGLPLSGHTNQAAYTIVANNTGSSATPTAMDVPTITSKASPVAADIILIQDSAASNAFKRTTVGAVGAAGAVSSFNTLTGAVTSNVTKQIFTTSGTYTPTSGMLHCIIECVGGGGGSGGIANMGAGTGGSPGGGGAGGYSRTYSTAAAIGASKTVTIGAAGAAGAGAGPTAGGAGGDTSVGTLCIAKGGSGGAASASGSGGLGGVLGTGDVTGTGDPGGTGMNQAIITVTTRGPKGGSSPWGGGGRESVAAGVAVPGENGSGYGSGAGAGATQNAGGAANGNSGTSGLVIITEFINL